MRYLIPLFFILSIVRVAAQAPQVPHKLRFANLTLTIRDDARKEIQKDVDALTQSPKHFNIKVERAKTYFPIIEKIFEEESLPLDFKYLVIQESALIADAVSTSKAVGFWQFKDFTAIEMGLRVDKEVDERLNIVSSTRAAARYFKRNNMHFDNWLFALQAYQMGAGGVMRSEKNFKEGATHMEITSKTYWYVKKYLAHKIAFESAVNTPGQQIKVLSYEGKAKQTLKDVANDVSVNETEIRNYNKWLKAEKIPGDKVYAVIVPLISGTTIDESKPPYLASGKTTSPINDIKAGEKPSKSGVDENKKINGIQTIKARPGETTSALAKRAGISLNYFLKYNEMTQRDKIKEGEFYFMARKRSRAKEDYHMVQAGEDVWTISQHYGVKVSKIRRYNRLSENESLPMGTVLYLSSAKPKNTVAPPIPAKEVIQVDKQDEFAWSSESSASSIPGDQPVQEEVRKTDALTTTSLGVAVDEAQAKDSVQSVNTVKPDSTLQISVDEKTAINLTQHVVKKGETLYGIARMYNVGVMDIVELNNLNIQDGIKPDQVLQLRTLPDTVTARAEPAEIIYVVQPSDTLYSVARKYGVSIKELMDWNSKSDFSLSVGEKLRVIQKVSN